MGLDMYLYAVPEEYRDPPKDYKPEAIELGYWRKHPNLHGYIVQEFAGGRDECQEIPLSLADLEKILEAAERNKLPKTTGFFFGVSTPEDKEKTLIILRYAIMWMKERQWMADLALKPDSYILKAPRIYYQASW